jgi:formylglycine-generating enzyme required for sulfatase activity
VLSPFFLDSTEITVAAARAGNVNTPIPWSGKSDGKNAEDWCTYTDQPGPRDALPMNCLDPVRAREVCTNLGGDLPTEAQLEYAMGGLRMFRFVWGMDPPSCKDAVWGRNGFGFLAQVLPSTCLSFSKALGPLGGPEVPGTGGERDVLVLPGGSIFDLTGNVSEWSRDLYQLQTESCWSPHGVMHDPYCNQTSKALGGNKQEQNRGGSWGTGGTPLEASARQYTYWGGVSPYNGFRCMRPAN